MKKDGLLDIIRKIIHQTPSARDIEFDLLLRKWQGGAVAGDDMLLLGFSPFEIQKQHS
jgi:hypothetical protein